MEFSMEMARILSVVHIFLLFDASRGRPEEDVFGAAIEVSTGGL